MSKIVVIARKYIGEKETAGNSGFLNKAFEAKMKEVGFIKGNAWCAYFAELVWKEAGEDVSIFSASAFKTYQNYEVAGRKGQAVPVPGALVVWRSFKKGKGSWTGHIGIVSEVTATGFKSIEGNTNSAGGREGIEVAEKTRLFNWRENDGLRLIGFIYPETK